MIFNSINNNNSWFQPELLFNYKNNQIILSANYLHGNKINGGIGLFNTQDQIKLHWNYIF